MVRTSSTRRTLRGTSPLAWMRGGWPMRWARRLPTWRPPPLRARQGLSGSPVRSASAAAISAAGSKPRCAERSGAVGTGTIVPLSRSAGASHWMRSAISSATGSRRRNFSAVTRSRATPSCGAEDQARSMPGGPPPCSGSAAGEAARAAGAEHRLRTAGAPAGGAERRDQAGGDGVQELHGPILRAGGARVARRMSGCLSRLRRREPRCRRPGSPRRAARRLRAGSSRGRWRRRRSGSRRRRSPGPRSARPRRARPRRRSAPAPSTSAPSSGLAARTPSATSGAPGSTSTAPCSASRLPWRSSSRLPMSFQ